MNADRIPVMTEVAKTLQQELLRSGGLLSAGLRVIR